MRSYDEYCAIAKSLDVVGDRWTLLIVRELALRGACRYTDLRNGLPGIATNLLAERLRELEHAGVIEREEAPPPIATTLLRLTPRGEQLRPVLEDLVRWGVPLMTEQKPDDAVRSHWLAWALELMLTDREPRCSGGNDRAADRRRADRARSRATARSGPGSAQPTTPTRRSRDRRSRSSDCCSGCWSSRMRYDRGVVYRGDPTVLDRIGVAEGAAFLAERAGEGAVPLAERASEVGRVHPDHQQRDER